MPPQVERITAEPRAQLEEKLKEVEETVGSLNGGGWDGGFLHFLGLGSFGVGVVVVIIDDLFYDLVLVSILILIIIMVTILMFILFMFIIIDHMSLRIFCRCTKRANAVKVLRFHSTTTVHQQQCVIMCQSLGTLEGESIN